MPRALLIVLAACPGAALPPPAPPAPVAVAAPAPAAHRAAPPAPDDLGLCVDEVNRLRARAKKPPLARSAELEAFAAAGAADDAAAQKPHHHFSHVTYPHPYREMGENEIPWWPSSQYGSVADIVRAGLAGMWDEGPGGGHYENLVGHFTQVGCGIHNARGQVTVVMDFLRPP